MMAKKFLYILFTLFTHSVVHVRCMSTMENVTRLLDGLLKNYRKEVRPGFGGAPVRIETDILVRSMGPILETEMSYSMQCYLRQRWVDERLKFKLDNITEVTLSTSFLKNIWKPNTYFLNGRRSQQHNITTPNVFVRIRHDGRIYMSRRQSEVEIHGTQLHVIIISTRCILVSFSNDQDGSNVLPHVCKINHTGCMSNDADELSNGSTCLSVDDRGILKINVIRSSGMMDLSRDSIKQLCGISGDLYSLNMCVYGSADGYTTNDIIYIWKFGNDASVDVYSDVTMSQFDMGAILARNHTEHTHLGDFAVLEVYFHLERHMGFFILQTYLPCTLIVCLSWVSFWINRDAAPARVLLGMTTILSTVAISMLQRDGLPRVPYATALDVYLNACIVYNLAAMIQYATVNYFTKLIPEKGRKGLNEEIQLMLSMPHRLVLPDQENGQVTTTAHVRNRANVDKCCRLFWNCLVGNMKYRAQKVQTSVNTRRYCESKIDITSRYLFPGSFGFFHIVYWSWYLNTSGSQYSVPD